MFLFFPEFLRKFPTADPAKPYLSLRRICKPVVWGAQNLGQTRGAQNPGQTWSAIILAESPLVLRPNTEAETPNKVCANKVHILTPWSLNRLLG